MRHLSLIQPAAALTAVLLVSASAHAAILGTYDDRSVWDGVTTGVTVDGLNDIAIGGGGWTLLPGGSVTRGDLSYTGYDQQGNQLVAINGAYGTGVVLKGPDYNQFAVQYLQISLGTDATAFGLDLASINPDALSFRIELSTGEVFVPITTAASPALQFWGVRTDTQFNWIRISFATGDGNPNPSQGNSNIVIDNIAFGSSNLPGGGGEGEPGGEVPEAATLLSIGSGLTLLALRRRQNRLAV